MQQSRESMWIYKKHLNTNHISLLNRYWISSLKQALSIIFEANRESTSVKNCLTCLDQRLLSAFWFHPLMVPCAMRKQQFRDLFPGTSLCSASTCRSVVLVYIPHAWQMQDDFFQRVEAFKLVLKNQKHSFLAAYPYTEGVFKLATQG